jgi:class 3 adenylate cyclase
MSHCPACASEHLRGSNFCCRCGGALVPCVRGPGRPERRDLTVMFCDLADSTELAKRLDLEELHEVVCSYQRACSAAVRRHGGHVAQYLGDGLLVYFGYPVAHADAAARAARTAVEILDEVERLNVRLESELRLRIAVRMGIHSGPIVLGDVGAGERRERLAIGQTVNVASRLQQVASPGTVVLSAATCRLLRGGFALEGVRLRRLKGLPEPVETRRLLHPADLLPARAGGLREPELRRAV